MEERVSSSSQDGQQPHQSVTAEKPRDKSQSGTEFDMELVSYNLCNSAELLLIDEYQNGQARIFVVS